MSTPHDVDGLDRRLLRSDAAALRAALAEHGSDGAVADAVGVSRRTVLRWRQRLGVEPVEPATHDDLSAAAVRLRDDPAAMREALEEHGSDQPVADAVGVNVKTVSKWRRTHGIDRVGRSGPDVADAAARLRDDPVALRAALAEHGSDQAVGAAVGVSSVTVGVWRDRYGIDPRRPDVVPVAAVRLREDRRAMRRALVIHGSDGAVAAEVGVAPVTIRRWRQAHGLPPARTSQRGR